MYASLGEHQGSVNLADFRRTRQASRRVPYYSPCITLEIELRQGLRRKSVTDAQFSIPGVVIAHLSARDFDVRRTDRSISCSSHIGRKVASSNQLCFMPASVSDILARQLGVHAERTVGSRVEFRRSWHCRQKSTAIADPRLHALAQRPVFSEADCDLKQRLAAICRISAAALRRWLGRELNPRHEDFQSSALPTELPSRERDRTRAVSKPRHYAKLRGASKDGKRI